MNKYMHEETDIQPKIENIKAYSRLYIYTVRLSSDQSARKRTFSDRKLDVSPSQEDSPL